MPIGAVPQDDAAISVSRSKDRTWAIVLAGGEGTRLRPLVERIHRDGRPKQFAVLMGDRSLLQITLDRVARLIPPERTVVVTTRAHAPYFAPELSEHRGAHMLVQPQDRGTAAGMLLPAHWIAWRDPGAAVAVFPSDHFVGDDAAFMGHVASLGAVVDRHPERIVLVGAAPDSPETGYGWIEPGMELERTASGDIRTVHRFVEKPSSPEARACFRRGGLWNTFVMASRVSTLVDAGRRALPELHERLRRIRPFAGSRSEEQAVDRAYLLAPTANFSQTILATDSDRLAVSRLPPMGWSDWGTPERVIATLRREGIAPRWLQELATSA